MHHLATEYSFKNVHYQGFDAVAIGEITSVEDELWKQTFAPRKFIWIQLIVMKYSEDYLLV
jgi:hypothetical protein